MTKFTVRELSQIETALTEHLERLQKHTTEATPQKKSIEALISKIKLDPVDSTTTTRHILGTPVTDIIVRDVSTWLATTHKHCMAYSTDVGLTVWHKGYLAALNSLIDIFNKVEKEYEELYNEDTCKQ